MGLTSLPGVLCLYQQQATREVSQMSTEPVEFSAKSITTTSYADMLRIITAGYGDDMEYIVIWATPNQIRAQRFADMPSAEIFASHKRDFLRKSYDRN